MLPEGTWAPRTHLGLNSLLGLLSLGCAFLAFPSKTGFDIGVCFRGEGFSQTMQLRRTTHDTGLGTSSTLKNVNCQFISVCLLRFTSVRCAVARSDQKQGERPAQSRNTGTPSLGLSPYNPSDPAEWVTGTGGGHSTFLGLWTRGAESSPTTYLPGKKQAKNIPQPCPPLAKKKNSRKQNTTASFYFVFFGNYTKDEKLIINISQSPPANSNYNRLNNKW